MSGFLANNKSHALGFSQMIKRILRVLWCFVLVAVPLSAAAQGPASSDQVPACRRFVQQFYDWYVPLTQKELNGPTFELALHRKSAAFSPELLKALRIDSEAQAHAKGEIVGIDFDPFVGGQDPADRYAVRKVTVKNDRCFAEVWRDSPEHTSVKSKNADVLTEVAQRAGHWEFVNFRHPDTHADLLGVLASLRKDRGDQ